METSRSKQKGHERPHVTCGIVCSICAYTRFTTEAIDAAWKIWQNETSCSGEFAGELRPDPCVDVRGIVNIIVKKQIPNPLHFENQKEDMFYSGNEDKAFCPKRNSRKYRPVRTHLGKCIELIRTIV